MELGLKRLGAHRLNSVLLLHILARCKMMPQRKIRCCHPAGSPVDDADHREKNRGPGFRTICAFASVVWDAFGHVQFQLGFWHDRKRLFRPIRHVSSWTGFSGPGLEKRPLTDTVLAARLKIETIHKANSLIELRSLS